MKTALDTTVTFAVAADTAGATRATNVIAAAEVYELLYVSTMAPTSPVSVVASIAAISRSSNASRGITGMLIFDGMRFCQQFEGKQQAVLELFERINRDPRHDAISLIYHGPLQKRRFKCFSLAFTNAEDIETLSRMENLKGQHALAAFAELLPTLDTEAQH